MNLRRGKMELEEVLRRADKMIRGMKGGAVLEPIKTITFLHADLYKNMKGTDNISTDPPFP